jgi:prophage regulatory protein
MATQVQPALIVLRRKQVEARTGLCRSTIYARVAAGAFPTPIRLGARAVGWIEHEIETWLQDQVQNSRNPARSGGRHVRR